MGKNYFEIKFQGPYKGVNVSLPEDMLGLDESPYMQNIILKNGEIRPRPAITIQLPGTPDKKSMQILTSFLDGNNIFHTVAVTATGLWQLNSNWYKTPNTRNKTWSLIGAYTSQPGPYLPASSSVFIDKFFWTNGAPNLYMWDGITSVGAPSFWKANVAYVQGAQVLDSNGKVEVAQNSGISSSIVPVWSATLGGTATDNAGTGNSTTPITWQQGGVPAAANGFSAVGMVDAANGVTAGAFFLIELNSQLIMLSTVESVGGYFPQRVRWSPSGLPTTWDPNVNQGAGYVDEFDVPDAITGAFTVGTTAFILRTNGITELTTTGNGLNPWNFNHLWASDRGIGNIYPYGYASYGPIGIFIANDNIYNVSMGGFKIIGGRARDAIFTDLSNSTGIPIASIVPYYSLGYIYNHYRLTIPQGKNNKSWIYAIEDDSWQTEYHTNKNFTGISRWSYTS